MYNSNFDLPKSELLKESPTHFTMWRMLWLFVYKRYKLKRMNSKKGKSIYNSKNQTSILRRKPKPLKEYPMHFTRWQMVWLFVYMQEQFWKQNSKESKNNISPNPAQGTDAKSTNFSVQCIHRCWEWKTSVVVVVGGSGDGTKSSGAIGKSKIEREQGEWCRMLDYTLVSRKLHQI